MPFDWVTYLYHTSKPEQFRDRLSGSLRPPNTMSDMEEDEDYGFEYETDDEEEEDVAIENQVRALRLCTHFLYFSILT